MFKPSWIVAAAMMMASCGPGPSDPLAEGARLMAELKAASGGAALDKPSGFHETGTVSFGGQTGTYETWGDLRALRWAGTHTRGGETGSNGFDGQRSWSVGPDHAVHIDTSPDGLAGARLGAYLTIAGYFYPDRFPARFESKGRQEADGAAFDVVTVTPADSVPIDFWLDAKTHRLQRLSGMDGKTPFHGVVEQYKVVDGVWIGFAIRQFQGGREMTQSLTTYEFVDVPAEKFSPPAQ